MKHITKEIFRDDDSPLVLSAANGEQMTIAA
jgi:hypothetical protein